VNQLQLLALGKHFFVFLAKLTGFAILNLSSSSGISSVNLFSLNCSNPSFDDDNAQASCAKFL